MADTQKNSTDKYFIGVDVGTGSVRSGIFTSRGSLVRRCSREIKTWRDKSELFIEQSSEDIWSAVVTTVKDVCSGLSNKSQIGGIGFDATCSLVVTDLAGHPITVSLSRDQSRNVILWQDHRSISETNVINDTQHPVLKFVGGRISPEMQPPKLLWLKNNLYDECWEKAGHFFDLSDYLTFRATGSNSRSLCCLVCKWTYVGHHPESGDPDTCISHGWNSSFWQSIGLSDLVDEGYSRIGTVVLPPGSPVENGLNKTSAKELDLPFGLPVATSIIDAHAGGLGMIGASIDGMNDCPLTSRVALIGGTSSCHMAASLHTSTHPHFVPGVWGPYYSAMLPGYFLNEGGQSSTGQLIDHVVNGYDEDVLSELKGKAKQNNHSVYDQLELELTKLSDRDPSFLTRHVHVCPDFIGNRSPLADPQIHGMCSGLSLPSTLRDLAVLYLATIQALSYGTRHILETMVASGHKFNVLMICGGLRQNKLYLKSHADITGLPVLLTEECEAVLLGAAILAAVASGVKLEEAMTTMSRCSLENSVQSDKDQELFRFHENKFVVFKELYEDQIKYRTMMK